MLQPMSSSKGAGRRGALILLAAFCCAGAAPAWAACAKGSKTVFSCTAAKAKRIQLCDAGKTLDYSFGKAGAKPEILLKAPRDTVTTQQWLGAGRHMSYSVHVPSADTTYVVFWSADRLDPDAPVDAGVIVEVKQKQIARVNCVNQNDIIHDMEGIDLKPVL